MSPRDSYLETMSLLSVLCDTVPPSCLDRAVANHVCPCLCLSTAAIRFFTLAPSVEAGCAVTLASSKSVQAHVWRGLENRWWNRWWRLFCWWLWLVVTNLSRPWSDFKRYIQKLRVIIVVKYWLVSVRMSREPEDGSSCPCAGWRVMSIFHYCCSSCVILFSHQLPLSLTQFSGQFWTKVHCEKTTKALRNSRFPTWMPWLGSGFVNQKRPHLEGKKKVWFRLMSNCHLLCLGFLVSLRSFVNDSQFFANLRCSNYIFYMLLIFFFPENIGVSKDTILNTHIII